MHYAIGVNFNLPYFCCCSTLEHVLILHTRHGDFITSKDLILFCIFFFLSSNKIAVLPAKMRETDWAKFREVKDNKFEGDPNCWGMTQWYEVEEEEDRPKLIFNFVFVFVFRVAQNKITYNFNYHTYAS